MDTPQSFVATNEMRETPNILFVAPNFKMKEKVLGDSVLFRMLGKTFSTILDIRLPRKPSPTA
jgi:hypothetical protein